MFIHLVQFPGQPFLETGKSLATWLCDHGSDISKSVEAEVQIQSDSSVKYVFIFGLTFVNWCQVSSINKLDLMGSL